MTSRRALAEAAEAFDAAERSIRAGRAALARALAEQDGVEVAAPYIPLKKAAGRCERDTKTVRRWCEKYQIGRKIAGRWFVDPTRLDDLTLLRK